MENELVKVSFFRKQDNILIRELDFELTTNSKQKMSTGLGEEQSSTSRLVKAYVNRFETAGKRVTQVLIVAPSFADDFVESAEMDTEVNISMLEAEGLKKILDAY